MNSTLLSKNGMISFFESCTKDPIKSDLCSYIIKFNQNSLWNIFTFIINCIISIYPMLRLPYILFFLEKKGGGWWCMVTIFYMVDKAQLIQEHQYKLFSPIKILLFYLIFMWKQGILLWLTELLQSFPNPLHYVGQWSQTQFLEGHSSAEFSSNQLQFTPAWKFLVILKTLISWFRCVWLGLEQNCAELWPSRNWVWDHWCRMLPL